MCNRGGGEGNARPIFFPHIEGPVKVGVFGASGFSREVADILLQNSIEELVFIDVSPSISMYYGYPVVDETEISSLKQKGYIFVIGIGENKIRHKIYQRYKNLVFPNIIHPAASFGPKQYGELKFKKGNIIVSGVCFTNGIEFGDFGIFNLNCTIGHDCTIEDFINIAPGGNISGNVLLEEGVYVGTNAAVLQGKEIQQKLTIGRYAVIGAGAVVNRNINPNDIVVGIPAKPINK